MQKGEPMRLIDADALIKYCDDNWIPLNVDAVNEQPTIEPERKKGKWRRNKISNNIYQIYCTKCKNTVLHKSDFCPNCGAEMSGDNKK